MLFRSDYLTAIIILLLVLISSALAFIQNEKSHNAAEQLSKLVTNKVTVLRDGNWIELMTENIVPGDILKLSAGDIIPADIKFLTTKDTFIAQAALTGESYPVEKYAELKQETYDSITDLDTIGFMGSNMISGSATAIVLNTGNLTYFGSMSKTLSGDKAIKSFERGINSISKLLIRLTLLMVPIVFLINGILKGDWGQSLLFSISIAVEIGRAHV